TTKSPLTTLHQVLLGQPHHPRHPWNRAYPLDAQTHRALVAATVGVLACDRESARHSQLLQVADRTDAVRCDAFVRRLQPGAVSDDAGVPERRQRGCEV